MLLAGGLLGELLFDQVIGVHNGWLSRSQGKPPPDPEAHMVLAELLADPGVQKVSDWLALLGTAASVTATDRIVERLIRDGELRRVEHRRRWRSTWRLKAVSSSRAAWPAARLDGLAKNRDRLTVPDGVLVGMLDAAGLLPVVIADGDTVSISYLRSWVGGLPAPHAALVADVRTALAAAVLTGRA